MNENKKSLSNYSLFTIHYSLKKLYPVFLMLFVGLISCGESYHEYTPEVIDVEHKADMPIIQYYMDSLREDFKDSLILMGYDEDSIDIRDSVFLEEYQNGTKDEEVFYNGGMGYKGKLFNFDIYNSVKWMIIATMDDTIIKRKKM